MDADKLLHNFDENEYGADYKNHFLEVYKIYLEMADRLNITKYREDDKGY